MRDGMRLMSGVDVGGKLVWWIERRDGLAIVTNAVGECCEIGECGMSERKWFRVEGSIIFR